MVSATDGASSFACAGGLDSSAPFLSFALLPGVVNEMNGNNSVKDPLL